MFRRPSKKQLLIRRVIVYTVMTLAVLVIVTGSILFILGYRLDSDKFRIEQGALVQFESVPSGADVTIDGKAISSRTPSKQTILGGSHSFLITKDNYEPWAKTVAVTAGTLEWLDYVRLVPKVLTTETIQTYNSVYAEKASPDYKTMVVQEKASEPTLQIVDVRSQQTRTSKITIPGSVYTSASKHVFTIDQWDKGGRYLIVKHDYGSNTEWLVVDTENVNDSVNVTRRLSVSLQDLQFAGTNGNTLFGLADGSIRKLDLSAATISRALVSNVKSFEMFETNIMTYVGTDSNNTKQVAGIYRDGDESSHVLRTVASLKTPFRIDTSRYYSDDYVAISEGLKVTVLKGRYPTSSQDETTSLKQVAEFKTQANVESLSFSPVGDYLIARAGLTFVSYEVEYNRITKATVETKEAKARDFAWLDEAYVWVVYDGHLSIREFDGTNAHSIMPMTAGYDAMLSPNGRYLYGMVKDGNTYRLQRVAMIVD